MALAFELKLSGVWTDVTAYVLRAEGELRTDNIVDQITIQFKPSVQADVIGGYLENNTQIRIVNGSNYPFAGTIWNVMPIGTTTISAICQSFTGQFLNAVVNEIYNDKTPEYILEDLVTKYTDLTYASSGVSGFTITGTLQYNNKKLIDCVNDLCNILLWQVRVDYDKNCYFEERGYQDTGLTLSVGSQICNLPLWERNTDTIINSIVFDGDNQEFNTTQAFNGDASTTTFTLTYVPNIVQVLVGGVLKTPEVTGSTATGDYKVDKQNKQVIFNAAPGAGVANVVVNYSYLVPIHIETLASSTLTKDEIRLKQLSNKSITTYADARKLISNIFNRFGVPQVSCAEVKVKSWYEGIKNNAKAVFIDNYTNPVTNSSLVISRIKFDYPSPVVTLVVGEEPFLFYNYQQEVISKLKELINQGAAPSIIQRYVALIGTLNINITSELTTVIKLINDTPIVDDAGTHPNCIMYEDAYAMVLEDFENTANWTASSCTKSNDTTANHFWVGTQGMKVTPTAGTSYVYYSATSKDMRYITGATSGTPVSGTAGLWVYVANGSRLTSLKLRLGSSSTAYKEYTADYFHTLTAPANELLTLALFDLNTPTASSGTADWTGMDYIRITITTTSNEPVTFDYLTASVNNSISMCGLGDRRTVFG